MERTLPKIKLLPSLLDRLTDDDPVNISITRQRQNIQQLEQELASLSKRSTADNPHLKQRQEEIKQQLEQSSATLTVLSASVSSLTELRACVKRDLDWLLNAGQYSPQENLASFPEVKHSVLNYGMPDLTGQTVSSFDARDMEHILRQVIIDFEPRIIKNTLVVRILADKNLFNHNAVTFEIEGELWAQPQPIYLHLRTEFELESGNVSVYDFRRAETNA